MFTVPLNFTEKTESPPSDLSPCYTLYDQPIIFNGSANFTFSCHFTGYPPVQSITWDLGHFNDYDCITYSEDNQVSHVFCDKCHGSILLQVDFYKL